MTHEEEQTLHTFETRVRQLLLQYGKLREENAKLQETCANLEQRLATAQEAKRQAELDLESLKIAKMMAISNEDLAAAKRHIEKLIRKVDRCLALMGA